MRRPVAALGAVAVVGATALCGLLPSAPVHAAASTTFDVEEALKIPELSSFSSIDLSKVRIENVKAGASPVQPTSVAPKTVGLAVLTNSTNKERNMTSQSEAIATTDTATTSTDFGFQIGTSVAVEGGVDFIVDGKVTATHHVNIDYSTNKTKTTTTMVTRTLPSQTVAVAPHSSMVVTGVLSEATFKGSFSTSADLVGIVTLTKPCGASVEVPIGDLLTLRRDDGSTLRASGLTENPDGSAHVVTPMDVSGVVGTEMKVELTDGATGQVTKVKTVKPVRSITPVSPSKAAGGSRVDTPQARTAGAAKAFTGTTFSQLAGSVHCNIAKVAGAGGETADPDFSQYPGVPTNAVPVGGPYTLGDGKLYYEGQLVAEDVSSAAGYINGSQYGDWRVNFVQGGVAKQANQALPGGTFGVVPATATTLGYNYYLDKPSQSLWYQNKYVAGGVTSASAWLSSKTGNTYMADYISKGVAKQTDSVTSSTLVVPGISAASQALPGRYFLTQPGGSLYYAIGSSAVEVEKSVTAASAFFDGASNSYKYNVIRDGKAWGGEPGTTATLFGAVPAGTVPIGYNYFYDPTGDVLYYKKSIVAKNVVGAAGWLSRFDGNTYLATYMSDVSV